jgi:hypothetical protein
MIPLQAIHLVDANRVNPSSVGRRGHGPDIAEEVEQVLSRDERFPLMMIVWAGSVGPHMYERQV